MEEEEQYDIEQKQDYLRNEILEPGYDPNEFLSFLIAEEGTKGSDLELWSMSELQAIVEKFKTLKNSEQQPTTNEDTNNIISNTEETYNDNMNDNMNDNNNNNNNNNEVPELNEQPQQIQNIPSDDLPESVSIPKANEGIIEEIECVKSEESIFNQHEQITVSLTSPEKVDKGLFSKAYTTFLITTQPQLLKVRKRYTDFEWLKNILSLHYPHTLIPPLPKKNFDKRFNESFLAKRMHSLENFLNYLLQNPLIKNSNILTDFLTITNENDFSTKQTSYNLKQPPKTTKDFHTISGKVKVNFNGDHETGIKNILTYSEMNSTLFDKLSIEYKALYNEMLSVSERLMNISNIWDDLYKHTVRFNDNDDIKEAFKSMSKISAKWSKCEQNQAEIIKNDIRNYFNYVNKEFISMKNLCLHVDTVKYNYYKESERLGNKKEELFRKGDTDKWELNEEDANKKNELIGDKQLAMDKMLPKESEQLEQLKLFYGATLNSVIEEYERHQILSGKNHANIISNYCRKQMTELTALQSSLGSGIGNLFEFITKDY